MLDADTVVRRAPAILFNEMDADVVMMDVQKGLYYALDDIGAYIWTLLEEPVPVGQILHRLGTEYDVTEAKCREDALGFLGELVQNGIIEVVE